MHRFSKGLLLYMIMRKLMFVSVLLYLVGCNAPVQPDQEIVVTVNDAEGRSMIIVPMAANTESVEMVNDGVQYKTTIATSPSGFYNLVSIKGHSQSIIPCYVPVTKAKEMVQITFGERGAVSLKGSDDNEALAAYVNAYAQLSRALWDTGADLSNPNMVKNFIIKADSVLGEYRCSKPVKEYLRIWGYVNAFDNYSSVQRILNVKVEDMPYSRADLLPQPHTVLDSPIAALFPNTPGIVYSSIPNKSDIDSALTYIEEHYTDSLLKKKVNDNIAARYVSQYNYSEGFDAGLQRLLKAAELYGLDPKHAEDFVKRRCTVPGQPFPENIVLQDKQGNVVDFANFRGKYVYIDMWASWCVPCLREVPELQKLEKELKNKNVAFVSISIDASEEAWKNKLEEKNMHGHQLWNPGGTLGEALGVRGIPFFAIYDPASNLYMHGAPRPSQGKGLVELLEGLK